VDALRSQLKIQTSTLLSSTPTHPLLTSRTATATQKQLLAQTADQQAHNQQCLYRACASVTTFRVRDPDPHAVDGGSVLGIRLEVMRRGRFLRPYYVLLNRPYAEETGSHGHTDGNPSMRHQHQQGPRRRYLRVHRHTIPPSIPLAGLAARYLPAPPHRQRQAGGDDENDTVPTPKPQDLSRFVRTLRRELVRYHNRMAAIADLRKAVGLGRQRDGEKAAGDDDKVVRSGTRIVDISPADAEARQIKVDWADGRTGRLVVDEDGEVVKFVAFGEAGRDRAAERELLAGSTRLEDVAKRLTAETAG